MFLTSPARYPARSASPHPTVLRASTSTSSLAWNTPSRHPRKAPRAPQETSRFAKNARSRRIAETTAFSDDRVSPTSCESSSTLGAARNTFIRLTRLRTRPSASTATRAVRPAAATRSARARSVYPGGRLPQTATKAAGRASLAVASSRARTVSGRTRGPASRRWVSVPARGSRIVVLIRVGASTATKSARHPHASRRDSNMSRQSAPTMPVPVDRTPKAASTPLTLTPLPAATRSTTVALTWAPTLNPGAATVRSTTQLGVTVAREDAAITPTPRQTGP